MLKEYQHISVSERGGVDVLLLDEARIDQYETATEIRNELLDAVTKSQAQDFVLDMRNLEYMSSVGYLPFIRLSMRVNGAGGRLLLCNVSEVITEMFTATQLLITPSSEGQAPFRSVTTLEEALDMLSTAT
jgi:anti-anti-sigma factor